MQGAIIEDPFTVSAEVGPKASESTKDWAGVVGVFQRRVQAAFLDAEWQDAELPDGMRKLLSAKPPDEMSFARTYAHPIEADADFRCKPRQQ